MHATGAEALGYGESRAAALHGPSDAAPRVGVAQANLGVLEKRR